MLRPRQPNVLRARYAISDVPAPLRRDKGVASAMEDECRDADYGKQRPHVHFSHQRQHASKGPWARRQAFQTGPRGPQDLAMRYVRLLLVSRCVFGRSGPRGPIWTPSRRAQGPLLACCLWWLKWTCGRCFPSPRPDTRPPSHWRPLYPASVGAGTSLIAYRARSTLGCRGATCFTTWNRGAIPFKRSPSSSPATKQHVTGGIGCSPRCCSLTSLIRRGGQQKRWATVTGMPCLMRTTPSCAYNSIALEAAR